MLQYATAYCRQMSYQIDQSGKIEQTEKVTVLAAANGKIYAVTISAKNKRRLQELFRQAAKPTLFIDAVFSVLLFYLLKQIEKEVIVEVDIEYPGHTKIIEQMLAQLTEAEREIRWVLVGKTSNAHDIAYKVYRKKLKIGKILTYKAVADLAIKIAGGYLNSTTLRENRHSAPANKINITQKSKKVKKKSGGRYEKLKRL